MPIYAFTCTACGHDYDRLQKMSDPDPSACPQCGAEAVKRQLTAPSFRLSGSGWYETDFKKDGDKKRNLTEKGEGAASTVTVTPAAVKSEPKAESKPVAKAEPASKPASKPAASAS
jgi:putative FmdB family regulatory protein